jgi:hypothetical protein
MECNKFIVVIVFFSIDFIYAQDNSGWISLFNGENLEGLYTWIHEESRFDSSTDGNVLFTVEDSMIKGHPGHGIGHIATIREYSNYHVRVEYRFGAEGTSNNAGMMYHINDNAGKYGGIFPLAIENQMAKGAAGEYWSISDKWMGVIWVNTTVDPENRTRYMPAEQGGIEETAYYPEGRRIAGSGVHDTADGWNTLEAIVYHDSLAIHVINGHEVFRAWKLRVAGPDAGTLEEKEDYGLSVPLIKGTIGLQEEEHEIYYRNWEIRDFNNPVVPTTLGYHRDSYKNKLKLKSGENILFLGVNATGYAGFISDCYFSLNGKSIHKKHINGYPSAVIRLSMPED